jgi:hypothetical protein
MVVEDDPDEMKIAAAILSMADAETARAPHPGNQLNAGDVARFVARIEAQPLVCF